jgi:hypothetical protein
LARESAIAGELRLAVNADKLTASVTIILTEYQPAILTAEAEFGKYNPSFMESGLLSRYSANVLPSTAQDPGTIPESLPHITELSKMQLTSDTSMFEDHQAIFISEIVEKIKIKLQEAGVDPEKLEDLTASIALSVASIIDDTAGIEIDGVEVHPYLTFRTNDDEIIHCGENSYTYEYVYGAMKKFFHA